MEVDIETTGIEKVEVYSLRNQNTIAQYIETQPILYLCLMAERRPGSRVEQR